MLPDTLRVEGFGAHSQIRVFTEQAADVRAAINNGVAVGTLAPVVIAADFDSMRVAGDGKVCATAHCSALPTVPSVAIVSAFTFFIFHFALLAASQTSLTSSGYKETQRSSPLLVWMFALSEHVSHKESASGSWSPSSYSSSGVSVSFVLSKHDIQTKCLPDSRVDSPNV